MRDNEHVEVHQVRGFVAENLSEALHEAHALSRGTRCKQYLFAVSLNPPETESVGVEVFEDAADRIESQLGLDNQPRIIVFHEKEGRRHAHAVWSRIDAEHMKAIHLPHYKSKLRSVAKELFLDHGWELPKGFVDQRLRDPTTFTLADWQQAKRAKLDARDLKREVQECYATSDSRAAFSQALKERGLWLAKGDRRGYVALHHSGEVFALSRILGKKAKDLENKLGKAHELPSIEDRQGEIAKAMTPTFMSMMAEARTAHERKMQPLQEQREATTNKHQSERQRLDALHVERALSEDAQRDARLKRGLGGIWQWVTGKRNQIIAQNEQEKIQAEARDRSERQALIDRQREERQALQNRIRQTRSELAEQLHELHRERQQLQRLGQEFTDKAKQSRQSKAIDRHNNQSPKQNGKQSSGENKTSTDRRENLPSRDR